MRTPEYVAIMENEQAKSVLMRLYVAVRAQENFKTWIYGETWQRKIGDYRITGRIPKGIWGIQVSVYAKALSSRNPIMTFFSSSYNCDIEQGCFWVHSDGFVCDLHKLPIVLAITQTMEGELEVFKQQKETDEQAAEVEFEFLKEDAKRVIDHFVQAIPEIEAMMEIL